MNKNPNSREKKCIFYQKKQNTTMSFAKYLSLLVGKSGHTYGQLSGYLEIQLAEAVSKSNYVKASALLKDPRVNVNWTYREKDFATCINMSAQKGDIKMMKLLKL